MTEGKPAFGFVELVQGCPEVLLGKVCREAPERLAHDFHALENLIERRRVIVLRKSGNRDHNEADRKTGDEEYLG